MKVYRIYTEDTPDYRDNVRTILANAGIDGYTLYSGQGVWKGETESCLVIEIIRKDIKSFAAMVRQIKLVNAQAAVLYTIHKTDWWMA